MIVERQTQQHFFLYSISKIFFRRLQIIRQRRIKSIQIFTRVVCDIQRLFIKAKPLRFARYLILCLVGLIALPETFFFHG
ncbi:hypothetical protein [Sorangium sp. So ce362]|uniref:hypothetical protein n=1 Tax=Sorangium sp. So ce362 TaxID=3133303 RepID=UPI003F5DBA15